MTHQLQFARILLKDANLPIPARALRELGIAPSFNWADPEGFSRAIVANIAQSIGQTIENVRVTLNREYGYAEITSHGVHIRWHNSDRPLVSLSDDEKVALYCGAERHWLGTYYKSKDA